MLASKQEELKSINQIQVSKKEFIKAASLKKRTNLLGNLVKFLHLFAQATDVLEEEKKPSIQMTIPIYH